MMQQYIKMVTFRALPIIALAALVVMVASSIAGAQPVGDVQEGVDAVSGADEGASLTDLIGTIIQVLLFIIGVISVIMIIIGGIMYTTSAGDSSKMSTAKNTILYAIIGLVVALLAYALVDFVLAAFENA